MKYLMLLLFAGMAIQEKKVYKEYNGGREGFSYSYLVLYNNHTYYYSERYDFPGTLKDEGEWQIKSDKVILTSNKRNKDYGNKKVFKGNAFKLSNNEVIIQMGSGKDKHTVVLQEKSR